MTHPTDDEIMSLAVRYLGEHAAHASTGLHRFARALLAEQARTEPHKAEDAPSDAMVDAYLTAQRAAVEEADRFGRPNVGGLHTNTVREACRAGLRAAIAQERKA